MWLMVLVLFRDPYLAENPIRTNQALIYFSGCPRYLLCRKQVCPLPGLLRKRRLSLSGNVFYS
jgi:hypothetical protein